MEHIRVFVEKFSEFQVEAGSLLTELNENLSLNLHSLRLLNVYDLEGFSRELLEKCKYSVFGEIVTDSVTEDFPLEGKKYLAVEFIPGQFDQRASSAEDCVRLIDPGAKVRIRSSRLFVFDDNVTEDELASIRHYLINAVEAREKDLSKLDFNDSAEVQPVAVLNGFAEMSPDEFPSFCKKWGLAMNADDLAEVVRYFSEEKRNPTETELRILDTYWSDHCRHTTFNSEITELKIDPSFISPDIECTLKDFQEIRKELGRENKSLCLMEIATIGARWLKKKGLLNDLEQSEENNACSVFIDVDVDGKLEKWLLQFKNETHNHPTEIEPFGGASTCLGGAIRDPLSGRAYVYQAMRVTGAGNIYKPVSETRAGKLPQRIISRKAAAGYSSYGNQIGLATTHVREIYHEGYTAKRLEVGAVVGAVKASDVRRESPLPGDVILLLGGRTGRDGIGGATGSSKEHTEASLETCGSEVQKGNAPEERKLQHLFRKREVTSLIKKSNDFGAGGVSVAIGELADGLDIYLDRVPVKYKGLNATELAVSESQERMAVVIEASDREKFEEFCRQENVEVTYVADVTDSGRMRLFHHGAVLADISRKFIDSAGARHYCKATVGAVEEKNPFKNTLAKGETTAEKMASVLSSPNVTSQKGLIEMFDSTIGRSTVLMPFGGFMQDTETQVSVQKIPTDGYTDTASVMAFGFNPEISSWSPYHGAAYAVVEACSKVVASGADWSGMRFSYQEYFERMTSDPHTWGKPLAALLGALKMQKEFGLPSIGGKDSMSGTFEDISVPPTLIAFGITTVNAGKVISPEMKEAGNSLYLIKHTPLSNHMPDVGQLKKNWNFIHGKIADGTIVSAWASEFGGVAEGLAKASFGNCFGFDVRISEEDLFDTACGSILVETSGKLDYENAVLLGTVTDGEDGKCLINGESLDLDELYRANTAPFCKVYPSTAKASHDKTAPAGIKAAAKDGNGTRPYRFSPVAHPKVYIPVFPGSNCDYDTAKAFRKAGAKVTTGVFCNLTGDDVLRSTEEMCRQIDSCHILALCGGFSLGDEPDGSAKFIASVLRSGPVAKSIENLLERDGLILGICNGFQALIKSGLLPFGKPGNVTKESPTLFRNDINRHISQIVTTRVASVASPWLAGLEIGQIHRVAVSHGEGKFVVSEELARKLFENGQVAFQYADPVTEEPTMESPHNPNGSYYAIEGIISPDGHILGKMGHSERYERNIFKNILGDCDQKLFENAVKYFVK
ncbi:MAG: phosphoribosylformylglycinamidine synthase [Bacteroidales bacterium]|nr:phosphoribosylformylglycinamidine synthase [Candidatus Cacconaster equifaecalis]